MAIGGALVKGMIGGALKERAKNIGKTKAGKLLAREGRVMTGKPQPKGDVSVQPQQTLAPAAPTASSGGGGGGKSKFATEKEAALSIKTTTIQVATLLKGSYVLEKEQLKNRRKGKEKQKRKSREGLLEKAKGMVSGFKMPKMPGKGLLDSVFGFVGQLIFGMVMMKMVDFLPTIAKILPTLGRIVDWVIGAGIWVVDTLANFINWGYKLVDGMENMVKNIFGEEGAEKFKTFMTNVKDLISAFLVWKLIGKKILTAVIKNIKFAFNIAKSLVTNAFKLVNFITGGAAQKGLTAVTKGLTKVGSWIGKKTGITAAKKMGGSLFKHGAKRAGKRVLLKMFGKTFVKTASKIFGRVPIVGPLIVGLVSLVAGEPIGKALFKTFGAALGGFLGSIAGTAISAAVAGATAGIGALLVPAIMPASVMIGEILGTFVGDMLYGLIFEGGFGAVVKKLKEAFAAIVEKVGKSLEAVKKFFTEGFERFVNNFPSIDISKIWGLPRALGAAAGLLGLKDSKWVEDGKVNKIPNLLLLTPFGLPFMIPHLINSFFPSGKKESVSTPSKGKSDVKDKDGAKNDVEKDALVQINQMDKSTAREIIDLSKKKLEVGRAALQEKDPAKKEALKLERNALSMKIRKLRGESTDSSGNVLDYTKGGSTYEKKLKTANEQGGAKAVIESISTSASYEEGSPEVITLPTPPPKKEKSISQVQSESAGALISQGSGGGSNPYESLYKGG